MGSVIGGMDCPNCEHPDCRRETSYKKREIGNEYQSYVTRFSILCFECGFDYLLEFRQDEDGSLITRDGTDNYERENTHCR